MVVTATLMTMPSHAPYTFVAPSGSGITLPEKRGTGYDLKALRNSRSQSSGRCGRSFTFTGLEDQFDRSPRVDQPVDGHGTWLDFERQYHGDTATAAEVAALSTRRKSEALQEPFGEGGGVKPMPGVRQ